ncbi:MAG TPA: molybdate ABC transporter substrate-binding protein [Solirubrobacteraceae bacterium]
MIRPRRWAGIARSASAIAASSALAGALISGCGGAGGKPSLLVSAAASLQKPFTRYGEHFTAASVRLSFAGSDMLAAQIEQGLHPDVFASANTSLPETLHARGLVEKPVAFAANTLVLAVPAGAHRVNSLSDLERPGVTLAIGTATVPVGSYTHTLLGRLPAAQRNAILANVHDSEPDVSGIIGKLSEGAVDAGFLYATDVAATQGALRTIELPPQLQPQVDYGVAVVKGSKHLTQARAFIAGLLTGAGRRALLESGFSEPRSG